MTKLIAKEFPDFDVSTLPTIPFGWVDTSWHNDACPSFSNGNLVLFVDYAEPTMRECGPDAPRYSLIRYGVGSEATTVATTDEWQRMLAAIEVAR